ncbi:MAG TPA: histidine kinase, partial [Aeromicrobium sp.]|nr:histidine kinase [Aeromicrobium sp.]
IVVVVVGFGPLCLVALVLRYRSADTLERAQIRWFAYFATIATVSMFNGLVVPQPLADTLWGLSLLCLPVGIAAAVLRYRLFDIDVLIRRSTVLAMVVTVLTVVYLGVAGLAAAVIPDSGASAVIAAMVVAALFQPARSVIARRVETGLFGLRRDPAVALLSLGTRISGSLAPREVLQALAEGVREALGVREVAVELEDEGGVTSVIGRVDEAGVPTRVALVYEGHEIGALVVGARGAEPLDDRDKELLATLARNASPAAQAVRLSRALQVSRERAVSAREEERRRLRRELHDGIGPTLAGLVLRIDTALALTDRPNDARRELEEVKAQFRQAVSDVRDLAYELRPPALDDLGLLGALRQHLDAVAIGSGIDVDIEAPDLGELPAAVEVAAFRIASEAVRNVIRHSHATACSVRIVTGLSLTMLVTDDGDGVGDERPGVGIATMRERADELGGSFDIESSSGEGTTVRTVIPLVRLGQE